MSTMSDDEQAIRTLLQTWLTATQAGDTSTVLQLMADDVLFLVAGQPPFGKAAFAAQSKSMAGVRIEARSEIREIEIAGPWAWCRTELTVVVTPPEGEPVRRTGPTLSILRKQPDGRWGLVRDANLLTKA
jgi:uncharacterized protein (TIGR02246 family)